MVAITPIVSDDYRKWFTYFILSVCVNIAIVSTVTMGKPVSDFIETPILKVNLMALAAPSPAPQKQQVKKVTPVHTPVVTKPTAAQHLPPPTVEAKIAPPTPETEIPVKAIPNSDNGKQASTVIHEATYRHQTPPTYPRRAIELGQQGEVTLHAEVLPTGHPRTLKIAQSSGHRLLDMAALAAVKHWEFEPTYIDGTRVTSWVRVPVNFVIQ